MNENDMRFIKYLVEKMFNWQMTLILTLFNAQNIWAKFGSVRFIIMNKNAIEIDKCLSG